MECAFGYKPLIKQFWSCMQLIIKALLKQAPEMPSSEIQLPIVKNVEAVD